MRMVKAVLTLAAVIGFSAPIFAKAHKDLGASRPGATEMKKKKKEEKKEEKTEDTAGGEKKEEKTEKTEETKKPE